MARFKKVPLSTREGKITYGNGIVDGIVLLAINEIPDVELYSTAPHNKMRSSAIKVKIEKDGVHVDITVKTHYSQNIADVAFKIQEAVRHNVEAMTEYHVASVNVIIKGVTFEEKAVIQATETLEVKEG
jgi:uncharacterized alkaline shock family protein YloU